MKILDLIEKPRGITCLLIIGSILTVLDLYTTKVGLERGYLEGSPFMDQIIANIGIGGFLVVNLILSALLLTFLAWGSVKKLEGQYCYIPLIIYCIIRGAAVVNNVLIIF